MGEHTKIQWAHHTFNPWRGCTKVSPGCDHCYAERGSKRNPGLLGVWGDDGTRVLASAAYWRKPIAWNEKAAAEGERHRVFCASLADIFEARPELEAPRLRLFQLIAGTPHLDWLLLTKRPENAQRMLEPDRYDRRNLPQRLANVWGCLMNTGTPAARHCAIVSRAQARRLWGDPDNPPTSGLIGLRDRKGGDPAEWPADLRVRAYPEANR